MKTYKVLICGTAYGQVYLSAFLMSSPQFKLAGILGKGSLRTQVFAKEFGVPFYTSVSEMSEEIDIACVAIRSTIAGGEGTFITKELLNRGIHVIQEHPLHAREIQECKALARSKGVIFHVNSHYINVDPIMTFIDYVRRMRKMQEPFYIEASAAPQTTFSLMDIIGQALEGLNPFVYTQPMKPEKNIMDASSTKLIPFLSIQGVLKGIPIIFTIQNYIDSKQFDNHYLHMHRISIGNETGNITLLNTHGPLIWSGSFSIDEEKYKEENSFRNRKTAFGGYNEPTAVLFTPEKAPSLVEISRKHWPKAVLRALTKMKNEIETRETAVGQSENYLVSLSEAWLELTKKIGQTKDLRLKPARKPCPDPVKYKNENCKS